MRAKKTQTNIRQEQITEAALQIISVDGINALSIARIAESVGIVPSAVYRHFNSKEDVLDNVLQHIGIRLQKNVAEAKKESKESLECLKSIMMRHVKMAEENRAIPHVVFSDMFYAGNPDRKAMLNSVITGYLQQIQKIVKQGQKEEKIHKDTDPETASVLFLGAIMPAVVLWNVSEGKFDIEGHVKKAWKNFKRSITP